MFQPARPSLIWSSEAKRRATWYGSSKVVDAVAIRPIRSVTIASADSSVIGSNEVTVCAALQRLHRHVQHRQVIGHEERVELARSSVWMKRIRCVKLKLASGYAPG